MPGNLLLEKVEAAFIGGCRILQYRNKSKAHKRCLREAMQLRDLSKKYHAQLLINDDVALALDSGADGVHLGQCDMEIETARKMLGSQHLIGATCHSSLQLAQSAKDNGANYVAFGRFFSSQTKSAAPPADIGIISQFKQRFSLPVVAIGGITLDNAPGIIARGANCLAVCHDLFHHDDPKKITQHVQSYAQLFSNR